MASDQEVGNTFIQLVTYDTLLKDIQDDLAGTISTRTGWKTETMPSGAVINLPIYTSVARAGVKPPMNSEGVDKVMVMLRQQVSKAVAMGYMPADQKAFKVIRIVDTINSDITLNSAYYGIVDFAAWRATVGKIREFLDSFYNAVVNGGLRDFGGEVLAINSTEQKLINQEQHGLGGIFAPKPRQGLGPQNPLY